MRSVGALPEGYRIRQIEGRLFLFDPRGILLPGPKDPSLIDAYAWRHAWRQVARELNDELADVQAGVRSLHGSRRLRQYMRMMEAVAQAARPAARPARRRLVAWGLVAASAAAVAAAFLMTPFLPEPAPEELSHLSVTVRRAPTAAAPSARPESRTSGKARAAASTPRRRTSYAISFGKFLDRATADATMHLIRSKGYIVHVARIGEEFWVVTRTYHTREQAERLVTALQQIRLSAELAYEHEI